VNHIDPGHVTAPDGTQYIHLSGGNAVQLSPDGRRAVGEVKKVYEGWPIPRDWAVECFCLESPKFTLRDGWYHLVSAQGGTQGPSTSHMIVSARSRSPLGPWENSPYNPTIRTWSRAEEWWSKGHGTLVEGPQGEWYVVLHGIRNGYRTLGRPTLIEPVEWTPDGWWKRAAQWPSGWEQPATYDWGDVNSFAGPQLPLGWQVHERFDASRWRLANQTLELNGYGNDAGTARPLGPMAMHLAYEVEVDLELEGPSPAGLLLYGSPQAYIGSALDPQGKLRRVQAGFQRYARTDEPAWPRREVQLKIVNAHQDVRFYARAAGEDWRLLGPSMEVSGWHVLRPVLFAQAGSTARFRNFRYTPIS
jgi:beta-xylosidase